MVPTTRLLKKQASSKYVRQNITINAIGGGSSSDADDESDSESVEEPSKKLTSKLGTTEFRGLSVQDVLGTRHHLQWTADDKKEFNKFSAAFKIARNVKPRDIKPLLETLGFIGHSEELDKELAQRTANALQYNLLYKLRFVGYTSTNGKPSADWPVWTKRWYLDQNWDGNTDPPKSDGPFSGHDANASSNSSKGPARPADMQWQRPESRAPLAPISANARVQPQAPLPYPPTMSETVTTNTMPRVDSAVEAKRADLAATHDRTGTVAQAQAGAPSRSSQLKIERYQNWVKVSNAPLPKEDIGAVAPRLYPSLPQVREDTEAGYWNAEGEAGKRGAEKLWEVRTGDGSGRRTSL
ncbi:hypothetical protein W97_07734 [Coniosporium apollinis CBS 100218]|uniref:Uncharacterized protein n=1 Tax=Coniosporium apollinis (strain CBS 100218) TaxID=1168221 RepID=R7Z2I8_CONA1|nr:uncharacterized protein W97_07734 [Coniosporium apollinis CBS 100218]EON68410.1 hypothetical protein W97_07734 [Coniosporium apollinis CBS 100218]